MSVVAYALIAAVILAGLAFAQSAESAPVFSAASRVSAPRPPGCARPFFASAAHTVLRIADGRARLVSGRPVSGLVSAVDDVARLSPKLTGEVALTGAGATLRVTTEGLPGWCSQRVRNVVGLYRARIRA